MKVLRKQWFAASVMLALSCLRPGAGADRSSSHSSPDDPVIHAALVSGLTDDLDGLRKAYWQARNREQQIGAASIPLSDKIFFLYNCSLPDREQFLSGQEVLASQARDRDWKNRMLTTLLSDEVYELNRLEGQNRFNKFSRVFNRASTSLSRLALLQPQAAVSLLWDGIYSLKKAKPTSVRERKMIYLSNEFLDKYPAAPERTEVFALRAQLMKRLMDDRAREDYDTGKADFEKGQFEPAEYHLERAHLLRPNDQKTSSLLQETRVLKRRTQESLELTLGVSTAEGRLPDAEKTILSKACRKAITGDADDLAKLEPSAPNLWDSIDVAVSALLEKKGKHEQALNRLADLARKTPASAGGISARKSLANPDYNLDDSFQKAVADMNADQRKYILTGRRTADETVYAAGNAAINSAGQAAVGVPALFGMDAAVRAISEHFKTQVSIDSVVNAGARYLRKYPDSPRGQAIASQLAELSRKAGEYTKSQQYLEQSSNQSPVQMAKLRENLAVQLYEQAKSETDLVQKKKLLTKLVREYPKEKITLKSGKKELGTIPPSVTEKSIAVPTKALLKDSSLLRYLGLNPVIVDKSRGNGELADQGICINPDADNIEFLMKGETGFRSVPLPKKGREWLLTAARQLRSDYARTQSAHDQLYRQKLPFAIEGGAGGSGVDVAPKIMPYPTSPEDESKFH